MGEFIVSARKYRPATFDSVVGQENVTSTLKNAIKQNHLAQAYLFCGPRGVGKTTCARILSKTINCSNITGNTEACDKCESCMAFNSSRSFNIHELDAASNNSVDDIRNLIEQVRIPPQLGKYSIYIIDEVHMLSAQAFNAFLKTLEEPPAHAIFILATTEKHKIIPTILSRCQIFDFNRIRHDDIVKRLKYIASREDVSIDTDALHIIAQKADGAMRDALSIFDQMVSFSGSSIAYKDVIDNLNVLDFEYYFKLADNFLDNDSSGSLLLFDEILRNGFDPHNFLTGLGEHLRNLLVCKDKETIALLEAGEGLRKRYLSQSEKTSVEFLFRALDILNIADIHFKTSKNQRLHTELCLVKLCRISGTKKKTEIEGNISGGQGKQEPGPGNEKDKTEKAVKPEATDEAAEVEATDKKAVVPETSDKEAVKPEATDEAAEVEATDKKAAVPETSLEKPVDDKGIPEEIAERKSIVEEPEGNERPEKEELRAKTIPDELEEAKTPAKESSVAEPDAGEPVRKSSYKLQTPSIKDALNGAIKTGNSIRENNSDEKDINESGPGEEDMQDQVVRQEYLQEQWIRFIDVSGISKTRLIQTIRSYKPRIEEDIHIIVELENADQKDEFDRYAKIDMLVHLKKSLSNNMLKLSTILKETKGNDKKPYTEEEKYKYLLKKNPYLKVLKKQLGLDFD